MKYLTKTLMVGAVSTLVAMTALAQPFPNTTWSIDENGPALLSGPIAGFANGHYQVDPVSGIMGWYYPLGGAAAPSLAGDVFLLESPTNSSDLLRFDGLGGVYFFSDLEPGDPHPDFADVALIPQPNPNLQIPRLFIAEVGQEGNNGLMYIPTPGQPGFDVSGLFPGVHYNFISDAVPEPTFTVLAVAGGGLLLVRSLRRTKF